MAPSLDLPAVSHLRRRRGWRGRRRRRRRRRRTGRWRRCSIGRQWRRRRRRRRRRERRKRREWRRRRRVDRHVEVAVARGGPCADMVALDDEAEVVTRGEGVVDRPLAEARAHPGASRSSGAAVAAAAAAAAAAAGIRSGRGVRRDCGAEALLVVGKERIVPHLEDPLSAVHRHTVAVDQAHLADALADRILVPCDDVWVEGRWRRHRRWRRQWRRRRRRWRGRRRR